MTAARGRVRWTICALLFVTTTINYVDRNALSVLKTTLQQPLEQGGLALTDVDYGWITFAFTAAYAAFPSLIGMLIDRFGVRLGMAAALLLWSAVAAAHGLVGSMIGFVLMRFLLGFAEAANFPASIKAVAMWFPQKERALATGVFNAGTALGVIASPVTVWLAAKQGWQSAFVAVGALGMAWLFVWWRGFHEPKKHPRLSREELAYIESDQPPPAERVRLPWTELLRYREVWPFLIGKFLTDPVWWFFLFWLPSYLDHERGQNPLASAGLVALIYAGSSAGSIVGGWASGALIKLGWSVGRARMAVMGAAALCMPAAIAAYYTGSFAVCVALIALCTAAHQAWSANLYTTATDIFPAKVSAAVVGLGSSAGGLGGMFMTLLAALAVQWTGNQQLVFLVAGVLHLSAWLLFALWFRGRFEQVDLDRPRDASGLHRPLLWAGALVALSGLAVTAWIGLHWAQCVVAASLSGAAQALTAALGVVLIGIALVHAGRPRRPRAGHSS